MWIWNAATRLEPNEKLTKKRVNNQQLDFWKRLNIKTGVKKGAGAWDIATRNKRENGLDMNVDWRLETQTTLYLLNDAMSNTTCCNTLSVNDYGTSLNQGSQTWSWPLPKIARWYRVLHHYYLKIIRTYLHLLTYIRLRLCSTTAFWVAFSVLTKSIH